MDDHELFIRANDLKLDPGNAVESRTYIQERYIALLGDLTTTGQQLANENAPREINEMFVEVASFAKETQAYREESPETMILSREIALFTGATWVGDLLRAARSGSTP